LTHSCNVLLELRNSCLDEGLFGLGDLSKRVNLNDTFRLREEVSVVKRKDDGKLTPSSTFEEKYASSVPSSLIRAAAPTGSASRLT